MSGHDQHKPIGDLSIREVLTLVPVIVFCVAIGVYPQPMLDTMQADVGVIEAIADKARARVARHAGAPVVVEKDREESKP